MDTHRPASVRGPAALPRDDDAPRQATRAGTAGYRARHAAEFGRDFYRAGPVGLSLSSIGIRTYLGDDSEHDDLAYAEAVRRAVASGVNVIDTAINYRCQRSERAIGRALHGATLAGEVSRDEIVVCTKGGYVPLDGYPPATPEGYQGYLRREFYARNVMTSADLVSGGHCLTPEFLRDCLTRSRANQGLDTADV